MGWWNIDNNDVLGDVPADTMTAALADIAANDQPILKECLGAILAIISGNEHALLETGHAQVRGSLWLNNKLLITVSDAKAISNNAIIEKLRRPLQRISDTYLEACGRRPRLSEILATFIFSLNGEPDGFIEGAKGLRAGDLRMESD